MQEGDQEAICTCKSSAQPAFVNVALSHGGESLAKTEPGIELTAGRLQPVMDDGVRQPRGLVVATRTPHQSLELRMEKAKHRAVL
ncbi:hypothetical protein MSG28_001757 [Choristoneura fumiferana]|uniref:Uncharacterized protein n=1 Tax=Choristoneura fumiferana TaxID=7141 RepID=A0ACC0KVZ1_CHOFU|nr:hypothetical protein MSG28_001757 [Choristoneura fumiferana]